MPSAANCRAASVQAVSGRMAAGAPPSTEKALSTTSSSMTSPNWRTPRGDNGFQPVDSRSPATVRGSTIASSRAASGPLLTHDMMLTLNQLCRLEADVSGGRDLVAASNDRGRPRRESSRHLKPLHCFGEALVT